MIYGLGNMLTSPDATRHDWLADAQALGVTFVRCDMFWSDVQPDNDTQWYWSCYDAIVDDVLAYGMDVVFTLYEPPGWAISGAAYPPDDNTEYATFCAAAAARYAPRGIHYWEIWNEPDRVQNWAPAPSASDYAAMAIEAADAIKAADASAFVISGSLTSTGSPAVTYLGGMATAGLLTHIDAVGYHPYSFPFLPSTTHIADGFPNPWQFIAATTPSFVSVLTANAKPNMPIWLTEYGAPTYGASIVSQSDTVIGAGIVPWNQCDAVSEEYQAQMATESVAQAKLISNVAAFFWFKGIDSGTSLTNIQHWFGLRRTDGTHKPAWDAFKAAIA